MKVRKLQSYFISSHFIEGGKICIAICICNPCFIFLLDLTENVQHNFSKRILSLSSLPYSEQLALLDLEALELRRLRFDLIYFFKVFNYITPFNLNNAFIIYTPIASSRSNSPYLQVATPH
jgi:hypothetical protein